MTTTIKSEAPLLSELSYSERYGLVPNQIVAGVLGVNVSTVTKLVKSGELNGIRVRDGVTKARTHVYLDSLVRYLGFSHNTASLNAAASVCDVAPSRLRKLIETDPTLGFRYKPALGGYRWLVDLDALHEELRINPFERQQAIEEIAPVEDALDHVSGVEVEFTGSVETDPPYTAVLSDPVEQAEAAAPLAESYSAGYVAGRVAAGPDASLVWQLALLSVLTFALGIVLGYGFAH